MNKNQYLVRFAEILQKYYDFEEDVARFYIAEIILVCELSPLESDYTPRFCDLKPENVLLDLDGHMKLTEFYFFFFFQRGKSLFFS